MWESPDLSGYSGGYGGADAASAASIGAGAGQGSSDGLGAQVDAWATGSDGGFPGLLGFNPAATIGKAATAVMAAIFGEDSIGPMGDFPGDAVSVSNDDRFSVVGGPLDKTFTADVVPPPGSGEMRLAGSAGALDGFFNDFFNRPAPAKADPMASTSFFATPQTWNPLSPTPGNDPRVHMTADDEMLWFRAGELMLQRPEFQPQPVPTANGSASPYGPLELEITRGRVNWLPVLALVGIVVAAARG